ncbi:phosphonate-transporting ATPase [Pediococcus argentinicus]|uniref:Phosphonate-transporting ATPase n=1 Tax=Pediococcus argentinicus TaxID=480391 RepID=A0A0R2NJ15_9LACO|nr:phosphonate-transporting ATPase [Pediococcus argentinicus]GEP19417.1 hypothetical protein LSA03_08010 [Pediococcus argentinicus]
MNFIEVKDMSKIYGSGDNEVRANDQINFKIKQGELTVIVGASGAGKSTLLNILGGMDTNTHGDILVSGKNISKYNDRERTTYRRTGLGFVFQFYNLVPNLTALENGELASEIVKNALNPADTLKKLD